MVSTVKASEVVKVRLLETILKAILQMLKAVVLALIVVKRNGISANG
ncbi:MAG: hypothetical protein QW261_09125 [Candidatus Jordarchaeaceae archaeon]